MGVASLSDRSYREGRDRVTDGPLRGTGEDTRERDPSLSGPRVWDPLSQTRTKGWVLLLFTTKGQYVTPGRPHVSGVEGTSVLGVDRGAELVSQSYTSSSKITFLRLTCLVSNKTVPPDPPPWVSGLDPLPTPHRSGVGPSPVPSLLICRRRVKGRDGE